MHRINRARVRTVALATMVLLAGGCSTNLSLDNVTLIPSPEKLARKPDWATFSGGKKDFELRPITAADLVDGEGQCAAPASEQSAGAAAAGSTTAAGGQSPGVLAPGGISLQMTECDVVWRAGPVEKVEHGVNERGERAVVLTYLKGPWPGIYRFTAGRLVSIERAPTPPPAAPSKPQKGTKKPAAT
jgi:hypothetical protein